MQSFGVKKKLYLSIGFVLYGVIGWFLAAYLIQRKVDIEAKRNGDLLDSFGIAFYYAMIGWGIYFLVLNTTSIAALTISRRLRDKQATSVFKATTIVTVCLTVAFWIYWYS